ncbi:hypothetical protein B0H11DRAFT_1904156 [Mycena galericulata]|nr:hypothetical protein B0H11DRAFT_1904156 [Mycena galericulata]
MPALLTSSKPPVHPSTPRPLPNLSVPSIPELPVRNRLSLAAAPWLHAGLQDGSLDVEGVARDLALQVDSDADESLVPIFRTFFQNICSFDLSSCDLTTASRAMDTQGKAEAAFQYLGIKLLNTPPARPTKQAQNWIVSKLVPMALADRLAWVAQPTNLAREVSARETATVLLDREKNLAQWWQALVAARKFMKSQPEVFDATPASSRHRSRCQELRQSMSKSTETIFKCNLETMVYALKAFLLGDPGLGTEAIDKLVKQDSTEDWTEQDLKKAANDTDILSLSAPVLIACLFHSGGVLTTSVISNRPPWPFVDHWLCSGNRRIVAENHIVTILDRKFWVLLVRAALGRLPFNKIVSSFFDDVEVQQILEQEPDLVEQQCLELLRPAPTLDTRGLYTFDNHFDVGFPEELDFIPACPTASAAPDPAPAPTVPSPPPASPPASSGSTPDETTAKHAHASDGLDGAEREVPNTKGKEAEEETPAKTKRKDDHKEGDGARGGDEDEAPLKKRRKEKPKEEEEEEEEEEAPSKKRRKGNSGLAVSSSDRELRPKKDKAALAPPPAPSPSALQKKSKARARPASTAKNQGGIEYHQDIPWLAVSESFEIVEERDCESLAKKPRLNPAVLHDLAEQTLDIPYWKFDGSADVNGRLMIKATKHHYEYRPFKATVCIPFPLLASLAESLQRDDLETLRKIVGSQPHSQCAAYPQEKSVPLHVHPYSQRFHSSGTTRDAGGSPLDPDIVADENNSIVFVAHEDVWYDLTARQKQELLRTRCALVVHDRPYEHDGETFAFDAEGLSAFTHLDRLAFIQDLGARKRGVPTRPIAGRPSDLLFCAEQRALRESSGEISLQGQVLNLLSNRLPDKTMATLPGWTQVFPFHVFPRHLATQEFACTWLSGIKELPEFRFPWEEVSFGIFANKDAVSWIHADVLFTGVSLACGEKLWFIGRLKKGLDSYRGIMQSRHAFDDFNGWTDMTEVWDFEMVHLSPHTTLYMPATTMHCVISITDCIGTGEHGIPISNACNCVLITLHNALVASITTNADHEPARRFLIRIFIFIALAFTNPHNTNPSEEYQQQRQRSMPSRMFQHLPDVNTPDGILDVLALRSFVVLFVALTSSAYPYQVKNNGSHSHALPIHADMWQELSYAWTLALELDRHLHVNYEFKVGQQPGPASFDEAADLTVLTMSASMVRYHAATQYIKKDRPAAFTTAAFQAQLKQMLGRFDLCRQHYEYKKYADSSKPLCGMNDHIEPADFASLPLVNRFEQMLNSKDNFPLLLLWNKHTLPFKLVPC